MEVDNSINKKAWNNSLLPLKSMGMTFLMLYMSGNKAGIFSILIVGYALVNTIKTLLSINEHFNELESISGKRFILQRMLYAIYSTLGIAFVVHKLGTMGFIPINRGDYIHEIPPRTFDIHSVGI
ncbi:multi-pass transmembrane protein [Cryptosporidium ryanae]|uniref:multi-pass transmembrane protein n=1 Tax=Cryptosporidium ryanae TaxID=515981 RepID=UPI00351A5B54|nr:multi-pass transmembrane protein [Cryptosporidium ryanae]